MLNMKYVKLEKNQKIYENLIITRRKFTASKTQEQYYAYELKYEIKNRKVTVNFSSADKGGYELIDMVYDGAEKVYLLVDSGESFKFNGYLAVSFDEDMMYSAKISPREATDRANLENILRKEDILERKRREELDNQYNQDEKEVSEEMKNSETVEDSEEQE